MYLNFYATCDISKIESVGFVNIKNCYHAFVQHQLVTWPFTETSIAANMEITPTLKITKKDNVLLKLPRVISRVPINTVADMKNNNLDAESNKLAAGRQVEQNQVELNRVVLAAVNSNILSGSRPMPPSNGSVMVPGRKVVFMSRFASTMTLEMVKEHKKLDILKVELSRINDVNMYHLFDALTDMGFLRADLNSLVIWSEINAMSVNLEKCTMLSLSLPWDFSETN
uniref:Uncharacterized protein n=1 Tax=Glossina pallidipes TaxID=7398 RepID=A0A1A9ZSP2_GLOPL